MIERTGGSSTLVAVGKVTGANITSAFLGTVEGQGTAKVALPYVRWASDSLINSQQRASIAIQNIGGGPATNVKVQYIDKDGVVKGNSRGVAFVFARFNKFTFGSEVLVLPTDDNFVWPNTPEANYIDTLVFDKLSLC